jgi:hypothetical protein
LAKVLFLCKEKALGEKESKVGPGKSASGKKPLFFRKEKALGFKRNYFCKEKILGKKESILTFVY